EKRSSVRQEPPCPVYELCGGCQLQHMTYEAQLTAKEELIREAFNRYTGLQQLPLRKIYGMDEPWHYRNKAQLQLGYKQISGNDRSQHEHARRHKSVSHADHATQDRKD